ncbi:RiPP maturation radical SAM C-methyltransferase [Nonomuraea turcica]|uniref:RiPP maturation radical SAM C-methyltransferase n=1 Tax=Nonomuraea sp. G32 TaxID=3067274 RepID=UPI00273C2CA1|nr:RiPP maturation radical SAM C-methyltransferase [Nonomuraea sp. G32]MDP4501074.1 RiPP maturation radical SAM C-methyltransferase [Nonomuraea sp. G32]
MRITLASMPWASIDTPSLALGILTSRLQETMPEVEVDTRFVNIECAEWMGRIIPGSNRLDYDFFALRSYFKGCGDWIFTSALYGTREWNIEGFAEQMKGKISSRDYDICMRLHAGAPEFIDAQAKSILATKPDMVCFTSTVQQNVASLALARRLKEIIPDVRCVMGGANCDGDQGAGLHRAFEQIDFVVRGEGERSFPDLIRCLLTGADLSAIPGLCWRKGDQSVANPMSDRLLTPAEMPTPNYDAYFSRIETTSVSSWFEPRLVLESARGCWWGEKHHCTFCGLNGSAMTFRSKPPEVFTRELEYLARRHKVMDFFVVDNILDMQYLNTAVREIAEGDHDYRIHYEIKSNMKLHHLKQLRDAGIVSVQPGIENLNATVLRLMDKGVSGVQNVRLLRDAESTGLSVIWNYLYGFPGESEDHYLPVIAQLPCLHHLQPPGGASRIALERFSPYFNKPELGFSVRRPHRQYMMIYDLPDSDLYDIAYLFDTPDMGIEGGVADSLIEALALWEQQHQFSTLAHQDVGDAILLANTRPSFDWRHVELRNPEEIILFRMLDQPRTDAALCSALDDVSSPLGADGSTTVRRILAEWRRLGLIFTDDGRHVHVATTAENQQLCRVGRRTDKAAS